MEAERGFLTSEVERLTAALECEVRAHNDTKRRLALAEGELRRCSGVQRWPSWAKARQRELYALGVVDEDQCNPWATSDDSDCMATFPGAGRAATHVSEDWRTALVVGSKIDAQDLDNLWYKAEVVEAPKGQASVLIHFVGWSSRWDRWLPRSSRDIAPAGTHAPDEGSYPSSTPRRTTSVETATPKGLSDVKATPKSCRGGDNGVICTSDDEALHAEVNADVFASALKTPPPTKVPCTPMKSDTPSPLQARKVTGFRRPRCRAQLVFRSALREPSAQGGPSTPSSVGPKARSQPSSLPRHGHEPPMCLSGTNDNRPTHGQHSSRTSRLESVRGSVERRLGARPESRIGSLDGSVSNSGIKSCGTMPICADRTASEAEAAAVAAATPEQPVRRRRVSFGTAEVVTAVYNVEECGSASRRGSWCAYGRARKVRARHLGMPVWAYTRYEESAEVIQRFVRGNVIQQCRRGVATKTRRKPLRELHGAMNAANAAPRKKSGNAAQTKLRPDGSNRPTDARLVKAAPRRITVVRA